MNLDQELALLTDAEAERCLNGLLKAYADGSGDEAVEEAMASPQAFKQALAETGETGAALAELAEAPQDAQKRMKVIRATLVQAADSDALRPRLQAYLTTQRDKLFDPITISLVLAGIVFVLSTKFSAHYENVDGKKQVKLDLGRESTSDSLLSKFFDILK